MSFEEFGAEVTADGVSVGFVSLGREIVCKEAEILFQMGVIPGH